MPTDANAILLNRTDLDSANDGAGSGSDETSAGGAVVSVPHGGRIGLLYQLGEADASAAVSSETLDMKVEVSPDGGSTWGDLFVFRRVTASAEVNIDESTGGITFRRGADVRLPLADAGQNGLLQLRCTSVASSTAQWAPFIAIVSPGDLRDTDLTDNISV